MDPKRKLAEPSDTIIDITDDVIAEVEEVVPGPPPPPLEQALRALAADLEAEIARGGDGARLARLQYERGRLEEERFRAPERALARYQQALEKNRDFLPAIRAARRLFLEGGNVRAALDLFEAELRLTPDPPRKAEVLVARSRVEETRLADRALALATAQQALEFDRQNRQAQKACERLLSRDESWKALDALWARMADAVADDGPLRAAIEIQRARLEEGRLSDDVSAVQRHQAALDRDPECVPAVEGLKRHHLAQKRWKELAATLEHEAARIADPRLRALGFYRAGCLLADRLGQTDRAIASLERAMQADPESLVVVAELGRLYEMVGRWEDLARTLQIEIELTLEPRERIVRTCKLAAVLEENLGRADEAMALYRAALAIDPTFGPALRSLGRMIRARGAWQELAQMISAELEKTVDPDRRASGHHELGVLLETELGDRDGAISEYERSLGFDPTYAPAFKALTRLLADRERFRELAERYEQAADGTKERSWAVAYLEKAGAIWEERVGELDRASAAYARVLEIDEKNLVALHALQRVQERAGRHQDLVRSLEREAERAGPGKEVASILHRVAEVLESSIGDADAAIAAYRRVLQVDPRHRPSLAGLGRLLHARDRWDDLVELYRKEMEVGAGGAEKLPILYKVGEIFEERLGRPDEAVRAHREALDVDPGYVPSLRALARIHRERGEWEKLAQVLEAEAKTVRDAKFRAAAFFRVAEIYEERLGALDGAADAYEACLEAAPGDVAALEGLARLAAARRDWTSLLEIWSRVEAAADEPGARRRAILAQAEVLAGPVSEPARAAAAFERALEIQPGNLVALVTLESLYRRLGRGDDLARTLDRIASAAKDVPTRVAALHGLAHLHETHTPRVDPTPTYARILEIAPSDPAALDALERIAIVADDTRALATVLGRRAESLKDTGMEASIQLRLGETLEMIGDLAGASRAYTKSLDIEPDALSATRGLARVSGARGDRAGLEEAARREASALRDGVAAARALLRAADSAILRGQPDGAITDLERALELDPNSMEVADRLDALLLRKGEGRRAVDLLTRAAGAATVPSRRTALHGRVGELQRDLLGDKVAAAAAFGRALRSDADHVPTLLALGELMLAADQWNEAVVVYQRVAAVSNDVEIGRTASLRLAMLWDEKLGEPAKALEGLTKVLKQSPKNAEALSRLAECYRHKGEFGLAVETLLRLEDVQTDPIPKVETLCRLADVKLEAGDAKGAAETLRRAVDVEAKAGAPPRALGRLAAIHSERQEWEALADAYRAQIAAFPGNDARSAPTHLALGELYATRLGRPEDAIGHMRKSVALRPGDVPGRLVLALHLRKAGRPEEAAAEYAAILDVSPLHVEAYRELRRLDERGGRRDRMHLAESVLVHLRAADPVEAHSYRTWRAARPAPVWRPLGPGDRARLLHPLARLPAIELLAETTIHLERLFPPDYEGFGLASRDRVSPRDGHPLFARMRAIADALGLGEIALYVHRVRDRGLSVEVASPPALFVPAELLERPDREQTFLLARALLSLSLGTFVFGRLTAREVDAHLVSVVRPYVPGYGTGVTAEDYLVERAKQVQKALPRAVRKSLGPVAEKHVMSMGEWSPPRFVQAAAWSLDRAGLLFADDLATALDHIKRSDPALVGFPVTTTEEAVSCLERSKAATDLVRFHLSDDHAALRRALGIADA